jgi:hypothetical protein
MRQTRFESMLQKHVPLLYLLGPRSDWRENPVNDTLVEADPTFADISFSAVSAALTR